VKEGRKPNYHPNSSAERELDIPRQGGERIFWTGKEQGPAEQRDRESSSEATTTQGK
jgi:hypothetical protein